MWYGGDQSFKCDRPKMENHKYLESALARDCKAGFILNWQLQSPFDELKMPQLGLICSRRLFDDQTQRN